MKKTGVKILVVKICFLFAGPAFLAGPKMGFCFGSSRAMAINATVDRSPVYIGKNAVGIFIMMIFFFFDSSIQVESYFFN